MDFAPPPEVIPNFDHPQSRAIVMYIAVGTCVGFAMIFVLMRIHVKLTITRSWNWDDVACLMGFGLLIAYAGVEISILGPGKPIGRHIWELRIKSFNKSHLQSLLAAADLCCTSAFFVKLSLFLLYLRLFKPDKITRWLTYVGILVCGLFYSVTPTIYSALSIPSRGQPDTDTSWLSRTIKYKHELNTLITILGAFGIFSDIYLLVIPIRSIFQLQLPLRRKIGVSSIFLIGILAISCSIASLFYRIKLFYVNDYTWFIPLVCISTTAEICAGLICSCIPILKPLFDGHGSGKPHFISRTTVFFRCSLSSFRQPFISKHGHSSDRLNSAQTNDHVEGKLDDRNKLKSNIDFTKSNEAV